MKSRILYCYGRCIIESWELRWADGKNVLASEAPRVQRLRRANPAAAGLEQAGLRPTAQPRARYAEEDTPANAQRTQGRREEGNQSPRGVSL